VADTGELGDRLTAARPPAEDALIEALVAGRLFGHTHLGAAKIDRFTLLERIGRGGTGDVFAAYDPVLDRKVALKLLRADAAIDADERGWLLREARAAARLTHPNVVAIHEVGELGDGIFVAMEYIDGVTLRAWLRDERPLATILEVFVQAGRGLAAAHEAGVIHRDFKPENVLVSGAEPDLRARVVDFGLARMIEWVASDGPANGLGTAMGTPAYMAPEQLRERSYDARSDQFSFCVALHEALTGEHPFGAGQAGTTVEQVLARMLGGQRPRGDRALPSWLRAILQRGLAVDPAERHASMLALVRTLESAPGRRSRGLLAAAGMALVVGSSALTIAGRDNFARSRCAAAEQQLHGVWDQELRVAARMAFAELELANADEIWNRLEPRIDDYARAWLVSREPHCGGHPRGVTLAPELERLRDACLDRRLAELGGLTELLGSADRATVLGALDAVDRLTPISTCDDVESLQREGALAYTSESAAAELLRQELLRRTSQAQAGHARELDAPVQRLLEQARGFADPGLLAEALLLRSLVDEAQGDYDAAATSLETAALEAIAGRRDLLHAELAVRLVAIHVRRREPKLAHDWAHRAEAAIRAAGADELLRARLLDHRGTLANLDQDHREAEQFHRRALAVYRQFAPEAAAELAASLGNLGLALLSQAKIDEATPLIEESLARFRERFGPNHPNVAAMLSNLGQAYVLAGEHELGLAVLNEALALKLRVFGPNHVALLTTLNNLGNAYGELGRNSEARAAFERALAIGEAELGADSPQLEQLLHNLAFDSWLRGDHEAVIHEATRALAVQRKIYGDRHPILALTHELLARGQLGVGDEQGANATIDHALELAACGQLTAVERGNLLLSAAWIKRANGAPEPTVQALADEARELLGDDVDPLAARELAELLDSATAQPSGSIGGSHSASRLNPPG
jgi:tetratricopeptide (TPR) repeat protein/predicted Ser/Thr protein kinase